MKRFLKPRSGCGRPDLGENVHRKIFGENMVLFHSTFSRHGKAQASLALLIWLNENALKVTQGHLMFTSRFALVVF